MHGGVSSSKMRPSTWPSRDPPGKPSRSDRSRASDLTVEPLFAYPGNAGPALERATGPGLEVPATVRQAVRRFIGSVATTAPS